MATMEEYSPLSQACIKALTDKLDDKRRFAANEIEKMTVEFIASDNLTMVNRLIIVLRKFCLSHQHQNIRKGGLLGLVAVMAGYRNGSNTEPTTEIINEAVPPILTCLLDDDPRVRYYAYEALYNVVKVSRANVLPQFEQIFDSLTRIVADIDVGVKTGFETLDKLLKDIIVDQKNNFSINQGFVSKLKEYLKTKNPFTRMFIISWIQFFDRLDMEIDMVDYLPDLLDGILNCLYDDPDPIKASALTLLSECLNKIESRPTDRIDMNSYMNTLLKHASLKSEKDHAQYTSIEWLSKFITLMDSDDLFKFSPGILSAILPCLECKKTNEETNTMSLDRRMFSPSSSQLSIPVQSTNKTRIYKISSDVNAMLLEQLTIVLQDKKDSDTALGDLETILEILAKGLSTHEDSVIKLAILNWFKALRCARPGYISTSLSQQKVFDNLVDTLASDSDDVVKEALLVITMIYCDDIVINHDDQTLANNLNSSLTISKKDETREPERKKLQARSPVSPTKSTPTSKAKRVAIKSTDQPALKTNVPPANQLIQALYRKFSDNQILFEKRGTFILLNLCNTIEPESVLKSFAEILKDEKTNEKFAYKLVQTLNKILLTSQPLASLRSRLGVDGDPEMISLFQTLYLAWSHSPIAAISLCLLTNNDCKANELVVLLSKEINVDILTQIDWLVQLIESPILQPMRMRLLDLNKNDHLIKCLYGLLMILPQSEARRKLNRLLEEVYRFAVTQSLSRSLPSSASSSRLAPSSTTTTTTILSGGGDGKDAAKRLGV